MKKKLLLLWICLTGIVSAVSAQNINVTGKVSDATGPLIGVTVKVRGTKTVSLTDVNGNYSINAGSQNEMLEFSYIGFLPKEEKIGSRKVINIVMEEDQTELDEIVVIGYGTARKSDLTVSISSVKGDQLTATPAASVTEMLRGKASGLEVNLNSGRPGSGSTIKIRGSRSLSSGNDPLYVVDGIPIEGIADINSQDVESIEVLKDAASQSIYGARAANGVVYVTTKRGKEGKTTVEYNGYAGQQYLARNFDFYNGEEFYQLRREAQRTDAGGTYPATPHDVLQDQIMEDVYASKQFVDWEDLMIKPSWLTKQDISVRGGSKNIKVSTNIGYYYQNGMIETSDYNRANFRLNLDWDLGKYFTMGTNLSYSKSVQNIEDGSFNEFITRPPLAKPYDEDGNPTKYINSSSQTNPLYKLQEASNQTTNDKSSMVLFGILKPFKNFSYRVNGSYYRSSSETGQYTTSDYPGGKSSGSLGNATKERYVVENIFNYDWNLQKAHKFNFTFIQSWDIENYKTIGYNAEGVPNDDFGWNGLPDAETIKGLSRDYWDKKFLSFTGRIRYNLLDRYLLNVSLRHDGASVFGDKNKWATFPSVSLAWRISEEAFMKDVSQVSSLKLRTSYGQVGNSNISPYRSLGLVESYPMLFQDKLAIGYLPTMELMNPYIRWEATASTNAALDLGMFAQRLTASVDFYWTTTTDLLVKKDIPEVSGYSTMYDNLGETKTRGVDLQINGDIIRQKDFNLSAGIIFSKATSEIVKIDDRVDDNGKPLDSPTNSWFVGERLSVYYDYEFDGIWQTGDDFSLMPDAKPGQVKLKDIDGDGKITTADRRIYSREPDWYGSFNTSIMYKGFDLYCDLYTVQGIIKKNAYLYDANSGGSLQGKLNGMKVNYWTPENPSNEFPRPSYDSNALYQGTIGYQDASYFRLRTLTLGYTLPSSVLKKIGAQKIRLYGTATNLWTSTDFKSYSPELNPGQYPEPKQVIFGLNVSF